jgi:hypothetical protein
MGLTYSKHFCLTIEQEYLKMLDVRTKEYLSIMGKQFPKAEIEVQLRAFWQRKVASPLRRRKTDPRKTGGTVFDIQPEVSSMEVVKVCTLVEPLVGFKLKPGRVIKRGGYRTCDEFVQHFLSRLAVEFSKYYSVPLAVTAKTSGGVSVNASK